MQGSERNGRKRWSRKEVAKKLGEVEESQSAHSQRQMAEELGGRITVETSTMFKGTTLLLELPTSDAGGTTG